RGDRLPVPLALYSASVKGGVLRATWAANQSRARTGIKHIPESCTAKSVADALDFRRASAQA
ncbi:MAG TPA: hypothetical protein VGM36_08650, partial [Rhizomicrobium sp.]